MTAAVLTPDLQRLLAQGQDLARRGDSAGARAAYQAALGQAPGIAAVHNALGVLCLNEGDSAGAERHFTDAAAADPAAPDLWLNVATARRQRGDDAGERDALLRVLDRDRRHIGGIVRLAQLHERMGEPAAAAQRWSTLLRLAEGIADPAPQFQAILDHARAAVTASTRDFAAAMTGGLAATRAAHSPAELRRFDACVDAALGRRRIYTNECHGLHFPFLPADEFFPREHFGWVAQLEAACPAIRAEAEALLAGDGAGLVPYVEEAPGAPPSRWSLLRGSPDWSVLYLWRFGERQAEACARAPHTAALLEALPLADMPGRAPTAFFSILRPRTRLPAHSGVSNTRAIVHLPLIVPEGCGFRVGGETREWREGEAFVFDDTIEHEAWNDSDQPRVVLIFDVWNPHLTGAERDLLRQFFAVADASGHHAGRAGQVAD